MEHQLFEASNGDCPYLENNEWLSDMFKAETLEGSSYESLINRGFRRSGNFFYKNKCRGCKECISIRILVDSFSMSKSQKKALRKNADVRITVQPSEFDWEDYELYRKYSVLRHKTDSTVESYLDFLVRSAVDTRMMRYFIQSALVGIGWVDVLPESLSSVYYAFDPAYGKRSLGVFSTLKEIEMAKMLNKPILHMGFWVRNCDSMEYKNRYRPYQLLIDDEWIDGW